MYKYNPVKQEVEILKFWEENKIRQKCNEKNKNGKPFYFLDGPPYTSGKIHLGTAWNKTLKDMVTRYKRMQGFDVWDRAGYDMHGLPTEGKVQKKLGMKTKEEILKYGLDKFVKECKNFAIQNLKQMNKDFKRLGVWLDFDNAYQTIDNEYIEGTWWLVKKAYEKNRLYEGKMTMTWCGSCQTALAKHELEYKEVADKSIYVKFKVKSKNNEFLIIWTTTPWTIPFNLGIMANPELIYVKAEVGNEKWIMAKDLIEKVMEKAGKEYKIIEEFKGIKLENLEYIHPFENILKEHFEKLRKESKKIHVVVMSSEYVTTEHGTGLVHMAPGCGGEDYEVGHREGIEPFNRVDELGYYDNTTGIFSGWHVKKNNDDFIKEIENSGSLVAIESYKHDYAHCWRCKNPIFYRTTTQWFFKVEDLIPKMRKLNKEKIYWVPEWAGSRQFDSWLENLRDNGITRQRFWGSPLPVWKCESCNNFAVVESRKELRKLGANKIPEDLHKPWIDEVVLPCKCGGVMKRHPDIMDVWIDAGVDSWASLGYPHKDSLFKKLFPADFITEAKDQIRGWFNLLFVASMLGMDDISFKACYMHGYINDAYGQKFSKSLGNYVAPDVVLEKFGADAFRYYVIGAASPGVDMNYNEEDLSVKRRNLSILWNLHNFIIDLAKTISKNPEKLTLKNPGLEEKYILSKLNSTIKKATEKFDKYILNEIPWDLEELFIELSRTYIQMVREKANSGSDEEKETVLAAAYQVMKSLLVLMSPVTPMITEIIYQNFKKEFNLELESVHLQDWPEYDEKAIDKSLEKNMANIKEIIQAILQAREKAQIGIRWPLSEAIIDTSSKEFIRSIRELEPLIKSLTNIKEIKIESFDKAETIIKPNFKTIGKEFGADSKEIIKIMAELENKEMLRRLKSGKLKLGKFVLEERHIIKEREVAQGYSKGSFSQGNVFLNIEMSDELMAEGYYRELIRRIQSYRKEAGLKKTDLINIYIMLDKELFKQLALFEDKIEERVSANALDLSTEMPQDAQGKKYLFHKKDSIKGHNIEVWLEGV